MNMNSNEVRNAFIDYFKNNDHRHVKSGSLVPENDPSLMFANSGMVQFKNVFTGMEQLDFKRATTSQKCVRAGGKHNDLENVGFTTRHHTFFEMLDYYRSDLLLDFRRTRKLSRSYLKKGEKLELKKSEELLAIAFKRDVNSHQSLVVLEEIQTRTSSKYFKLLEKLLEMKQGRYA